jgi:hypothetical protein
LSAEIVALLVLLGGVVAAVAFTIVVVVAVDPSEASRRPLNGGDGVRERESEN